jgi:hypothetical protein
LVGGHEEMDEANKTKLQIQSNKFQINSKYQNKTKIKNVLNLKFWIYLELEILDL